MKGYSAVVPTPDKSIGTTLKFIPYSAEIRYQNVVVIALIGTCITFLDFSFNVFSIIMTSERA